MIEKTILIADDDDDLCQALALRCRGLGMKAVIANDGIHALQLAEKLEPDLICLDIDMPGGNGLAVCEMLSGIPGIDSTSITILTGSRDLEKIERCRHLGASYIFKGGNAWNELEALISKPTVLNSVRDQVSLEQMNRDSRINPPNTNRVVSCPQMESMQPRRGDDKILHTIFTMLSVDENYLEFTTARSERLQSRENLNGSLMSEKSLNQPWVLHVDDDSDLSDALKLRLEANGVSMIQAFTGRSGFAQAFVKPVSAIILDLDMPNGDGRYVLESLKAFKETSHIPVFILTGHRDDDRKQEMLMLGADSFLVKPIPFETLFSKLLPYLDLPNSNS